MQKYSAASRKLPSLWGWGVDGIEGAPGAVDMPSGEKGTQTGPAVFLSRSLDPSVPRADHPAPKQAQRVYGVGCAHAAAVLRMSHYPSFPALDVSFDFANLPAA